MTLDVITLGNNPTVGGGIVALASPLPGDWTRGVTGIGTDACLAAGVHLFCVTAEQRESPTEKEYQSLDSFAFTPYAVEVSVLCSNLGITSEAESRAQAAAEAKAEAVLGAELATGTLTGNPSLADATDFGLWPDAATALSGLEGAIALTIGGYQAWVHVAPSDLVLLAAADVIWRDLSGWRTPGGHVVVSSPGYQATQEGILVATAPVYAEVGEVFARTTQDRLLNRAMATFEAPVLAAFDPCGIAAVRFPETSPTSP